MKRKNKMAEELKYFCSVCGKQIEIGEHVLATDMSDIRCERCFDEIDKTKGCSYMLVLGSDNHLRYSDIGHIIYWNKKE